jgi:hypothetical protein
VPAQLTWRWPLLPVLVAVKTFATLTAMYVLRIAVCLPAAAALRRDNLLPRSSGATTCRQTQAAVRHGCAAASLKLL